MPSNKEPLAAAAEAVLGFAGCKAIGGVAVLEGLKDAAMGNAPVLGSGPGLTGEASRDAGVVDVAGGGCGGLLQAWDDAPDGGLAVVNRAMGGGDARSSNVSNAEA